MPYEVRQDAGVEPGEVVTSLTTIRQGLVLTGTATGDMQIAKNPLAVIASLVAKPSSNRSLDKNTKDPMKASVSDANAYNIGTQKERILVVDDNEGILDGLHKALADEGFLVVTASTSAQACALLEAEQFALTVLDWNLRGREWVPSGDPTGRTVLGKCRDLGYFLPVIVISGDLTFDVRTDAITSGADEFLEKPFSVEILIHCIQKWIEHRKQMERLFIPAGGDIPSLEEMKRQYVLHVVNLLNGNLSLAAKRLKVHRHTVASIVKGVDTVSKGVDTGARNPKGSCESDD